LQLPAWTNIEAGTIRELSLVAVSTPPAARRKPKASIKATNVIKSTIVLPNKAAVSLEAMQKHLPPRSWAQKCPYSQGTAIVLLDGFCFLRICPQIIRVGRHTISIPIFFQGLTVQCPFNTNPEEAPRASSAESFITLFTANTGFGVIFQFKVRSVPEAVTVVPAQSRMP